MQSFVLWGGLILFVFVVAALAWWAQYVQSVEKRAAFLDAAPKAKLGRHSKIVRWIWTTCADEETCEPCRALEGKEWKQKKDALKPPLAGCTNAEGCRCDLVGVYDDEGKVILET